MIRANPRMLEKVSLEIFNSTDSAMGGGERKGLTGKAFGLLEPAGQSTPACQVCSGRTFLGSIFRPETNGFPPIR
jgi:hypothetical protein